MQIEIQKGKIAVAKSNEVISHALIEFTISQDALYDVFAGLLQNKITRPLNVKYIESELTL